MTAGAFAAGPLLGMAASAGTEFRIRNRLPDQPATDDPLYRRAADRAESRRLPADVRPTQYVVPEGEASETPELQLVQLETTDAALKRLRIFPRSNQGYTFRSDPRTTRARRSR